MPAISTQRLLTDRDFLSASPADQIAYLKDVGPDFAAAPASEQLEYLSFIKSKAAPEMTRPEIAAPKLPMQESGLGKLWPVGAAMSGMLKGVGKSIASTTAGGMTGVETGYERPGQPVMDVSEMQRLAEQAVRPKGTAQKVGYYGTEATQYLVPGRSGIKSLLGLKRPAELITTAERVARDVPLQDVSKVRAVGERLAQLHRELGREAYYPSPIRKFVERTAEGKSMTFEKARDVYKSTTQLTEETSRRMSKETGHRVREFARELQAALQETTTSAGVGTEYGEGMARYRTAMQLRRALEAIYKSRLARWGAGLGIGGAALKRYGPSIITIGRKASEE